MKGTAGARYDKFYNDIATSGNDSVPPNLDYSPKPGQFSPKIGAALTLLDGIDLYANAARGLKAPSQVNSKNYQRVSAKLTYGNSAWKGISPYLTATAATLVFRLP